MKRAPRVMPMLFAVTAPPERESPPHYDLPVLARGVRDEYFPEQDLLAVRWGHRIQRARRMSIRLGSYNHRTKEIRIHPLLDSPLVPPFFIESILYHEYLHHVLGPRHGRRFQDRERRFKRFVEAKNWLRRNLHMLLGMSRAEFKPATGSRSDGIQLSLFETTPVDSKKKR